MKIHLLHSSTLSGKASMTKVVSTLVVFGVLFIASLVVTGHRWIRPHPMTGDQ